MHSSSEILKNSFFIKSDCKRFNFQTIPIISKGNELKKNIKAIDFNLKTEAEIKTKN